jgi:hypothetical protein
MKLLTKAFAIAALVVAAVVLVACGSSTPTPPATVAGLGCEGSYSATIDMPDHETRIASRNTSLVNAGQSLTNVDGTPRSEDELNAILGGGTPDGGIYLSGYAKWTTGAQVGMQCPITGGEVNIFGYSFALNGGINAPNINPEFGFGYEGGPVVGKMTGNTFTGKVIEGGNPHVHGVLSGTFTPAVEAK